MNSRNKHLILIHEQIHTCKGDYNYGHEDPLSIQKKYRDKRTHTSQIKKIRKGSKSF